MKKTAFFLLIAALAGCATQGGMTDLGYTPIVDLPAEADKTQYVSDLADCQQYAQRRPGASNAGAGGAIVGALLGGLIGAAFGNSSDAAWFAGFGALGAASGAADGAETTQRQIIRRCLANRGYAVLD